MGTPIEIRYPNGVRTVKEYNSLNRLIRLASTNAQGQLLTEFLYTLDPAGHRTRIEETVSGRIADYQYDALYRLTEEAISDPLNGDYLANYDYDEVGNRTRQTINGQTQSFSYNPDNSNGGDTKGRTGTYSIGNLDYSLTYNEKNQLIQTKIRENGTDIALYDYTYDLDGIRTQTTDVFTGKTTDYLIDHNRDYAQVLLETDSEASIAYLYGDDLIRQSQNSTEERYYLYDGLGSTQALTDETGHVTDDYTCEAFGQLLSHTGSSNNTYLFAGEQFDPSSQSYRLRARNYFAPSGRFTRMDTWMGYAQEPQTLHKYLYAHSNPVNNIDPTGKFTLSGLMSGINDAANLYTTASTIHDVFSLATGDDEVSAKELGSAILLNMLGPRAGKVLGMFGKRFADRARKSGCGKGNNNKVCNSRGEAVPRRVQSRVNLANCTKRAVNGKCEAGMEHIINEHYSGKSNKSQFLINRESLGYLLQTQQVVSAPVKALGGGRFKRQVNLGWVVGNSSGNRGGAGSKWLTVYSDEFGNIITAHPGR